MFCFKDEKINSPNSFPFNILPFSPEIEMEDGWSCPDPSDSNQISTEDPKQQNIKVEFPTPTPPSIPEIEAYAYNESSISDYCSFPQVVLSLPPIEGVDLDFDFGIKYKDSGPSNGAAIDLFCILMIRFGVI